MEFKIYYPTPLSEIKDIYNDNIDVCVKTEQGESYTFLVVALNNLKESIWLNKRGYITPCAPFLIVEKLSEKIIEDLLNEVFKDQLLANLYGKI
jgi:hypothetical protein